VLEHDSAKNAHKGRWYSKAIDCTFARGTGAQGLQEALDEICQRAEALCRSGVPILVLSHNSRSASRTPVPSLLATGAVHHHLIRNGLRTKVKNNIFS